MNDTAFRLNRFYARLLRLYPRGYREDFADEMQEVFRLSVKDAAGRGHGQLLQLTLRELGALPLALLASYIRERRKVTMQKQLNRWFVHEAGSWQEVLLASLPFLMLCLFLGLFSFRQVEASLPSLVGLILLGVITLTLALLGIAGMLVKLPRWALPYAGVLVSGIAFLALMLPGFPDWFFGRWSAPWLLRMVTFEAVYLVVLLVALTLIVWLARKNSLTASFVEQVQKDWSLVSFAMYGGALILVMGMYEDVINAGPYLLLTTIPFFLGAWLYLRQQTIFGKMITLSLSVAVAMGIALVANGYLLGWTTAPVSEIGGLIVSRSILSVVLSWLLSEAMLFVPALLHWIPFSRRTQAPAAT